MWAPYVMIYAYGLLVGKPEGKYSSVIQRLTWDDPVKGNVRHMTYDCGMNSQLPLGWPALHPVTIPNTITWPLEVVEFGKEIIDFSDATTALFY